MFRGSSVPALPCLPPVPRRGIRGTLSPCTALRLYRVTEISCLRHEGYDAVSPTSHRTSFGARFIGYRASRTPLATNFFRRQIAAPFTFYLLPFTFYLTTCPLPPTDILSLPLPLRHFGTMIAKKDVSLEKERRKFDV